MDTVGGHGAWCQPQSFAVEGGGVWEGAGWDEEVDVRDAGDHFGGGLSSRCCRQWWLDVECLCFAFCLFEIVYIGEHKIESRRYVRL